MKYIYILFAVFFSCDLFEPKARFYFDKKHAAHEDTLNIPLRYINGERYTHIVRSDVDPIVDISNYKLVGTLTESELFKEFELPEQYIRKKNDSTFSIVTPGLNGQETHNQRQLKILPNVKVKYYNIKYTFYLDIENGSINEERVYKLAEIEDENAKMWKNKEAYEEFKRLNERLRAVNKRLNELGG